MCVILGTHAVDVVVNTLDIFLAHLVGTHAKCAIQYPVGNKRSGHELFLEVETIAAYLVGAHCQCGSKVTEQAVNRVDGNFPNAEESQHMVNAVGVKVLSHLGEALDPPLAAVGEHGIPVIGWEAPVLTVG